MKLDWLLCLQYAPLTSLPYSFQPWQYLLFTNVPMPELVKQEPWTDLGGFYAEAENSSYRKLDFIGLEASKWRGTETPKGYGVGGWNKKRVVVRKNERDLPSSLPNGVSSTKSQRDNITALTYPTHSTLLVMRVVCMYVWLKNCTVYFTSRFFSPLIRYSYSYSVATRQLLELPLIITFK